MVHRTNRSAILTWILFGLIVVSVIVAALVYYGSVILLQSIVEAVTQERSPLIIVTSALLIAAPFVPLRRRVQPVIDRRFFRKKYDAHSVLAQVPTPPATR